MKRAICAYAARGAHWPSYTRCRASTTRLKAHHQFRVIATHASPSWTVRLNDVVLPGISNTLNALTGYSEVVKLKERVLAKDAELNMKKAALEASRNKYEELIESRRKMQRELNALLNRKDTWLDSDVERFTLLYRQEITLEQDENTAKQLYKNASEVMEKAHVELLSEIRERYIEEQLYSDKIRSVSTWYTWALILVHLTVFLSAQFLVEPARRERFHAELSELIKNTAHLNQNAVEKQFMVELRPLVARLDELELLHSGSSNVSVIAVKEEDEGKMMRYTICRHAARYRSIIHPFAKHPTSSIASQYQTRSFRGTVMDTWLPALRQDRPTFLTKAWRSYRWLSLKKFLQATFTYVRLWYTLRPVEKASPPKMKQQFEELYLKMNEELAAYNFEQLAKILSPPMQNAMQVEMAKLKRMGKMYWKSHGKASKTKFLHAVIAKTPNQMQEVFQFTMEMNYRQSVVLYKEKKGWDGSLSRDIVGGNADKIVPIREYIVFERIITYKEGSRDAGIKSYGNWRIAGKLEHHTPSLDTH
ncbi:hypothetical protein SeMB42_g04045 [Synchytrium endobioticum]|uniref:Sensitive to high expression protein 9, mitochondrial n=1 Tax=Synchytrium endobioticum TaxID=286115 RepID=A0A507DHD8_9FUNG|nr:hypothetical protein SeMB42_g04045 [Synchytrium endobioticum]TPX51004.1 hypothetical protein SeLEV6574_g00598 [Synchytrium endobioticum]